MEKQVLNANLRLIEKGVEIELTEEILSHELNAEIDLKEGWYLYVPSDDCCSGKDFNHRCVNGNCIYFPPV